MSSEPRLEAPRQGTRAWNRKRTVSFSNGAVGRLLGLRAVGGCCSLIQLRPWQPTPPVYTASLRMLVGALPAAEQDVAAYDPRHYAWLTSEYLVDDFTEVVRSQLFAERVSQRLQGLSLPPG
jgi:hypothetical protein